MATLLVSGLSHFLEMAVKPTLTITLQVIKFTKQKKRGVIQRVLVLEVFVIYPLYDTCLRMVTRVAETCACWRFTEFII